MVDLWKNLVFLSLSLSHWMRDFCLHKISSWAFLSSSFWLIVTSCDLRSSDKPWSQIWLCMVPIWSVSFLWASKIFPKVCLFQVLSFCLKFLSFLRNLYILDPCGTTASLRHVGAFWWKSGWLSQNCSSLKGFHHGVVEMSIHSWIGQWYDPWISRILSSRAMPSYIRELDRRNWSSL